MSNKVEDVNLVPSGNWTKWGKAYLLSIFWIVIVIIFAYLNIFVEFLASKKGDMFFDSYAAIQASKWAAFANAGFLILAIIDYYRTHHTIAWFVGTICGLSILIICVLPSITEQLCVNNGIVVIREEPMDFCWVCYTLHGFFLVTLYIVRAETQRALIIAEYNRKFVLSH